MQEGDRQELKVASYFVARVLERASGEGAEVFDGGPFDEFPDIAGHVACAEGAGAVGVAGYLAGVVEAALAGVAEGAIEGVTPRIDETGVAAGRILPKLAPASISVLSKKQISSATLPRSCSTSASRASRKVRTKSLSAVRFVFALA